MTITYVPRMFGGTLILITGTPPPPLTSGPVVMLLADALVNVVLLTDASQAQITLTDQARAAALLSEEVV